QPHRARSRERYRWRGARRKGGVQRRRPSGVLPTADGSPDHARCGLAASPDTRGRPGAFRRRDDRGGGRRHALRRGRRRRAGVAVWTSTQVPHLVADAIAECLGIDRAAVRVVATDVGGGFGAKAQVYPEEILLAWIARRVGTPVKWTETRSEHMQAASHARDQRVRFEAAV